jgi:NAD(P)-dependent dehydrogenase (short-subunit alcohol dehydrogenase family)
VLKDKIVLITGGAGLLGSEIVRGVLEQGATVIVGDCNFSAADKLVFDLQAEQRSLRVEALELDITCKESIVKGIDHLFTKYGRIDALVNNAYPRNKNYGRDLLEVSYSDFCENVNLHLGGYFLTTQEFCRFFLRQGFGSVVNVASVYGVIPPKFNIYEGTEMTMPVEYAAIKSAVIHLTKYFASYFKGCNIRVNCISPGGIFNNQPAGFVENYKRVCSSIGMLSPKDLIGSFCLLLSDAGKAINGQNIIVDDGFSL